MSLFFVTPMLHKGRAKLTCVPTHRASAHCCAARHQRLWRDNISPFRWIMINVPQCDVLVLATRKKNLSCTFVCVVADTNRDCMFWKYFDVAWVPSYFLCTCEVQCWHSEPYAHFSQLKIASVPDAVYTVISVGIRCHAMSDDIHVKTVCAGITFDNSYTINALYWIRGIAWNGKMIV